MWRESGSWVVKMTSLKPRISRLPTLAAGCRRLPPLIFRCVFLSLRTATMVPGHGYFWARKGGGCPGLSRFGLHCPIGHSFLGNGSWVPSGRMLAHGHHWDTEGE